MALFLPMKGRFLVDVPQTGHKAGAYDDIEKNMANALIEIGAFDPAAADPADVSDKPRRKASKADKASDQQG